MDTAALVRKYGSTVLGVGIALWLVALYLLGSAAQNSACSTAGCRGFC
jgi:hypothetical protein